MSGDSLNYCTHCGGPLELKGGTDPDDIGPRGEWEERYECSSCGGVGWYEYSNETGRETYRGVTSGEVVV